MDYKVIYESSNDGDCCSVWVTASNKEEAKSKVREEYWDCKEILIVERL